MISLAALVLTYNEEQNIRNCLESIKWIDEIVVVDSFSDDKTVEIAENYTEEVFKRKFDDFASQRNFGLDQIESDWILVVDADERVTEELKEEIKDVIFNSESEGYRIPRKNYFLGKWIKYLGWYPDFTLRLFKNSSEIRYSGLVHEGLKIEGQIMNLNHSLIHYTYRDLHHYVNKMNHYSSLDAEKKFKQGKSKGLFYIMLRPCLEFIKIYIIKKGFLLGSQGFILSIIISYYQFLKNVKLWEKSIVKPNEDAKDEEERE